MKTSFVSILQIGLLCCLVNLPTMAVAPINRATAQSWTRELQNQPIGFKKYTNQDNSVTLLDNSPGKMIVEHSYLHEGDVKVVMWSISYTPEGAAYDIRRLL